MLPYQPCADLAGIVQTPHELSSPLSALSAETEKEGDRKHLPAENLTCFARSRTRGQTDLQLVFQ